MTPHIAIVPAIIPKEASAALNSFFNFMRKQTGDKNATKLKIAKAETVHRGNNFGQPHQASKAALRRQEPFTTIP